MEEALKKARKKFDEAIRGRDYQDKLLKGELSDKEKAVIQKRRDIFQDRVCLLFDIFGQSIQEG
jgi:hypothetical protein